jgi:hypothetical protein
MTIIDSSDPQVVIDEQLHWRLVNRAVLTTAVVRELQATDNPAWDKRPRAALQALSAYLRDVVGFERGRPDDGLDELLELDLPEKFKPLVEEIRRGVVVCKCMMMLWTADTSTEYTGDLRKLNAALADWRMGDAMFFAPVDAWKVPSKTWELGIANAGTYVLYMVAHQTLDIRKVGITVSDRLDTWRRRGWDLVKTIEFDDEASLRAAERRALQQLDRLGARATPRMEALYANLDANGRTEMYDPAVAPQNLAVLISEHFVEQLGGVEPAAPIWITEPLKAAAKKAWNHPSRDGKAAAKKAVATRQQNALDSEAHLT